MKKNSAYNRNSACKRDSGVQSDALALTLDQHRHDDRLQRALWLLTRSHNAVAKRFKLV